MEFEKIYAPSLKDLFIQQLQDMILSGELPMGSRLPSERELCQQMGVSRAVVNGGITELARQGFLEVLPRQGTYVADYRRNGNMNTLMAIMHYNGGLLGREEMDACQAKTQPNQIMINYANIVHSRKVLTVIPRSK